MKLAIETFLTTPMKHAGQFSFLLGAGVFVAAVVIGASCALAQDLLPKPHALRVEGKQSDFPALCTDKDGIPCVAFVQWDGTADTLHLAKLADGILRDFLTLGTPGIIHQPAIAKDGTGALHVVWSQVNDRNIMDLKTAVIRDGRLSGEVETLAASPRGGNVLAKASADRAGNVWVVWQGMRGGLTDIFCRVFELKKNAWSAEIQVTHEAVGDWEPCVALDAQGGAWVCYDSARGNEFNIYATHIDAALQLGETKTLIATPRYEARVSAITAADSKGAWLTCERGNEQWGMDTRAENHPPGLNGRRDTVFAFWDFENDTVKELPTADGLIATLASPTAELSPARTNNPALAEKLRVKAAARAEALKAKGLLTPDQLGALNLPHVMLDAVGSPWLTVRYFKDFCWSLALTRYEAATQQWTVPTIMPNSVYSQDRHTQHALGSDGSLWLAWPSDLRLSKLHQTSTIQLAKLNTAMEQSLVTAPATKVREPFASYINPITPERARDARHSITHGGTTYHLYWADYHRHTDLSNCVTANDGCVLEQYRYALDMGKLDSLGTSDHTDIAKIYHPYEWWLNQKMVDVFYTPGFFVSMYAYEREQAWPHGHRNVIFAQRGGPIVYIQRKNYLASPWQSLFPVATEGTPEMSPQELWDVLGRYGSPLSVISHTGGSAAGTDWSLLKEVDHRVENVIEIFQGARISYEGKGAPQPTVGMRQGGKYQAPFGRPLADFKGHDNGTYQHALEVGHKLGVWADSDHVSAHTSYGGLYLKEFTREGIIEALNARRTIAATDKIFIDFSCNDQLLGTEVVVSGKPVLKLKVDGTAAIKRVTLVRNEQNHQQWEPNTKTFEQTFSDETPISGESRYYLRVEQSDGNMAWSSPIWVQAGVAKAGL